MLLAALVAGGSHDPVEFRVRHADGRLITTETHIVDLTAVRAVQGIVLTIRDVSERKRLENLLSHQAFHDAPYRAAQPSPAARPAHACAPTTRIPTGRWPCSSSIWPFKVVNDSLGHSAGDQLLVQVARVCGPVCAEATPLPAWGATSSTCSSRGPDAVADAVLAARTRSETLRAPIALDGQDTYAAASIGIAGRPGHRTAAICCAKRTSPCIAPKPPGAVGAIPCSKPA